MKIIKTLVEIEPGSIFMTIDSEILAVKTEYFYGNDNPQPMCILLSSGEFAHFPNKDKERVIVLNLKYGDEE